MSVVRRCPQCGTQQTPPGECEACHEANVRYYCTNHSPGLWLEAKSCPTCGATFGAPAPSPPRPRPSGRPPSTRAAAPSPSRSTSPPRPVRMAPSVDAPDSPPPATYMPTAPPVSTRLPSSTPAHGLELSPLERILRSAIRPRSLPVEGDGYGAPSPLTMARTAAGCVVRLFFIVVALVLAAIAALFVLGRSLL